MALKMKIYTSRGLAAGIGEFLLLPHHPIADRLFLSVDAALGVGLLIRLAAGRRRASR